MTLLPWFIDVRLPTVIGAAEAGATGAEAEAEAGPPLVAGLPSPQFYLGGPGTGAPFHYHHDAINVLAWGRKRWYMRPPQEAEYSTVPAADLVRHVLPALNATAAGGAAARRAAAPPLQCTQRGGDVLYVPSGWGHAVLNTRTSVGFAVEFDSLLGAWY